MSNQSFNLTNFKLKNRNGNPSNPNGNETPQEPKRKLPYHKKGERFLMGPIPWNWLSLAGRLPGRTLHVATAIWFLAFVKNKRTVKLEGRRLNDLGVSRGSVYRALIHLEKSELIKVDRHNGRRSIVTLLELSEEKTGRDTEL